MSDVYEMPPAKTRDDITKVIDFITARVKPLRDSASYNSDEGRAYQALLDMAAVLEGAAQSEIERGDNPAMPHFYLAIAARQWSNHPDFLPEWNR